MNSWIRTNLYWVIPGLLVLLGLFLLFYQNFSKVTAAPEDNWSRGLLVGETQFNKLPKIIETTDGEYQISLFQSNKIITKIVDRDLNVEKQKTYDIPVDKWTQVYFNEKEMVWFDYSNILDENKQQIVTDVEEFYPLDSSILYIKENVLYHLNPDTKKSTKMMDIDLDNESISLEENEDGIHALLFHKGENVVNLHLYKLGTDKVNKLYETKLKVDSGKKVNNIAFTYKEENLALLLQEELELTQGNPEYFNYFAQTVVTNSKEPKQFKLTFQDPAQESSKLKEVNDVTFIYRDGKPRLLFKANGYTDTKYNEKTAFNIYETEISEDGQTKTERRSNTAEISTIPQWLNKETVAWVDLDGEENKVYISSSDVEKIDKKIEITSDHWLQALGKTFGMIALSFFALAVSFIWFMWPILFVVILYVIKSRAIDYDRSWVFYTGVVIYLVATLLFKDRFFIPSMMSNAPSYLTFTGSTYFYLLFFAVIAFLLTMMAKRLNEWTGAVRVIYFVAVHIILTMVFFGPYIIY